VLGREVIGHSVRHRPLVAYRLGNRAARPTAVLIGQMHGDEHAGVVLAHSLIHGPVSVEGLNLWVIPTMNPDGDAARTRQNAHGVDLNRNWPDGRWRHLTGMFYSGPHPLSEPESRAVCTFLLRVHPKFVVVLHQPLHGVDTTDGGATAVAFRQALARNLGLPQKPFRCFSVCHGSLTHWYTHKRRLGAAETVEFGAHPSHAYLVGRARRGIITALHGRFGSLAAHNPTFAVAVTGGAGAVSVTGFAYDIDNRSTHLAYRIGNATRVLATGHAARPTHAGHGLAGRFSLAPGRHTICTVIANIGAGTKDPRTCRTVTVSPPEA
jgi:protein MpaA